MKKLIFLLLAIIATIFCLAELNYQAMSNEITRREIATDGDISDCMYEYGFEDKVVFEEATEIDKITALFNQH